MKTLLLSGLLLATPLLLRAQYLLPTVTVEYGLNRMDESAINGFYQSFNTYWQTELASPWEMVSSTAFSHPNLGLGLRGGLGGVTLSTNYLYGRGRYTNQAVFNTGLMQEQVALAKDHTWDFQIGGILFDRVYLQGLMAAYIRKLEIRHYTVFPDGSRSLGNAYALSGIYDGLISNVDIGFSAGYRQGPFLLQVKWYRPTGFPPGKFIIPLIDYDTDEVLSELPRDYALWVTDPVEYASRAANPEEGATPVEIFTDSFAGTRLLFTLEFLIGYTEPK